MRILLIGDSIVGGFGRGIKQDSFVHKTLNRFNINYVDLSCPGITVKGALDYFNHGKKKCSEQVDSVVINNFNTIIISLGNVDGKKIIKKNNFFANLIPNRYLGYSGYIDERPYYTSNLLKKIIEVIENKFRFFFKFFALLTKNLDFPTQSDIFKNQYIDLINIFNNKKIIIISTSSITNNLFPSSKNYFDDINIFFEHLSQNQANIHYFNLINHIEKKDLLLDKFHLTREAHNRLSTIFEAFLKYNVKI